ncbi:MAG TPA: glutaredoxin domain-containing protein [Candidatus Brocadiales bacterium]|nr:glutaredoxin domain-containing protein [Candidatus Brocadiales bacterium]
MANVKIYTTPTCPFCKKAKDFFKSSNIAFEEIDVSKSKDAMEFLAEKGFMGVPVIAIGEEYIQGFDEKVKQRIKEALGL